MTTAGDTSDPVGAAKQRVRRLRLDARRALDPATLLAARVDVARHVLAALGRGVAVVAAYEPLRTEPGSVELLAALHASGRSVLVPVTLADRDLSWTRWSPDPAAPRPDLGREAVADVDVVLVPALAVGADGGRLGRGGGSYDRALPRTRARVVALLHRGELLAEVPTDIHDVPVSAVVTPDGWRDVG